MSLRGLLVDAVGQLDEVETALTPDGAIMNGPRETRRTPAGRRQVSSGGRRQ